jgi:hypothetical protein
VLEGNQGVVRSGQTCSHVVVVTQLFWQFQTPLSSSCGSSQPAGIGGMGRFDGQSLGTPGGNVARGAVLEGAAVLVGLAAAAVDEVDPDVVAGAGVAAGRGVAVVLVVAGAAVSGEAGRVTKDDPGAAAPCEPLPEEVAPVPLATDGVAAAAVNAGATSSGSTNSGASTWAPVDAAAVTIHAVGIDGITTTLSTVSICLTTTGSAEPAEALGL